MRDRPDDLGKNTRYRLLAAFAYSAQSFVRAQQTRGALRQRCQQLFEGIYMITTPTMQSGAPALGASAIPAFTAPFDIVGWPAITVPVGIGAKNLPLGLQLVGKPWKNALVLRDRNPFCLKHRLGIKFAPSLPFPFQN